MLLRVVLMFAVFGALYAATAAHAAETARIPAPYSLSVADVEDATAIALAEKSAGARIRATLTGAKSPLLYESAKPVKARITSLTADKATSRWTANVLVMSGEQTLTAFPASGRFEEMTLLPVLKRQVRSGEIISANDIDHVDFPVSTTRADAVTDGAQLIGFSPRGTISPKRPVRAAEIAAPAVVHKGRMVTMRYATGTMEITTSGQALSDGAQGEMIQVRNLTSKTIVHATVDNQHSVTVGTPNKELAGEFHAAH